MIRFFTDISAIQKFTAELKLHRESLECQYCAKSDQWISHGFIYKYLSSTEPVPVGKRIFCSNRCQHGGCGRTFQLYLSSEVPGFRLGAASRLFVFISALLAHRSVKDAYQQALGNEHPRTAWHWINRLMQGLTSFRCRVSYHAQVNDKTFSARRLQLLLPTLQQLFSLHTDCSSYQVACQEAFM